MNGASIITASGIEILLIDFSGLSGNAFIETIPRVNEFLLAIPKGKRYPSITDLTNARVDSKVRQALKEFGKVLEQRRDPGAPRKPSAVAGLGRLERTVAAAITGGTKYFSTKEEAIDFLVKESS